MQQRGQTQSSRGVCSCRGRSKRYRRPPRGVRRAVCRRAAAEGQPVRLLLVGARAPGGGHRRRSGGVALAAGAILPGGDPQTHVAPGATPRNDYRVELPIARVRRRRHRRPGNGRAIGRLSGGPWRRSRLRGPGPARPSPRCSTSPPARPDREPAHGPVVGLAARPRRRSRPPERRRPRAAPRRLGRRPLRRAGALVRGPGGSSSLSATPTRSSDLPRTTCSRPTASPPRSGATTAARAASSLSRRPQPRRPRDRLRGAGSSCAAGTTARPIRRNQPDG